MTNSKLTGLFGVLPRPDFLDHFVRSNQRFLFLKANSLYYAKTRLLYYSKIKNSYISWVLARYSEELEQVLVIFVELLMDSCGILLH